MLPLVEAYVRHLDGGGILTPEEFLATEGNEDPEALEALRVVSAFEREVPKASWAGERLGPYRLESELGSGGMGTVFLASVEGHASGLERGDRVAIKVIHPHLISQPGFFKRFLREAEAGGRIRHENVVRILDADAAELGGSIAHYLVMEHVEGRTLRGLLRDLGSVPEALLREVADQVAAGLAAIHAGNVVHRDLKPENVLITEDHRVRIMDLGVARLAESRGGITHEGQFVGTAWYAAPEQFRDGEVGPAADLYSLGVLLYELSTGRNPFRRPDAAAVIGGASPPRSPSPASSRRARAPRGGRSRRGSSGGGTGSGPGSRSGARRSSTGGTRSSTSCGGRGRRRRRGGGGRSSSRARPGSGRPASWTPSCGRSRASTPTSSTAAIPPRAVRAGSRTPWWTASGGRASRARSAPT
jgi:serine/threonine protein kinase